MCVMSGGVSGGRGGRTRKERRVQSEKQEPHTVMWGTMKNGRKSEIQQVFGSAGIREVNLQWCKMVQVCSDFQGGKKVA
jgi:hypothetical protein